MSDKQIIKVENPKEEKKEIDLWISLCFWFNKAPDTAPVIAYYPPVRRIFTFASTQEIGGLFDG